MDESDLNLSIDLNGTVVLTVERDALNPPQWIWMMFSDGDEPWYRLTLSEAAWLRDRLNYLLRKCDANPHKPERPELRRRR